MTRWRPNTTVAAVIEQDGRFLLVEERQGAPTVFNQPAGHLEAGETLIGAVHRETLEESGWSIDIDHYLGLYINEAPNGVTYHSHSFLATPRAVETHTLDSVIVGVHWFTPQDIQTLHQQGRLRSPLVLRRIQDALAGKRYPLDLINEPPYAPTRG
ncbi:NUDIX hydrolase [Larsenimonas salina]|uniref:NUDIX hydrolase n=1 Tax=Larsenimonas salina TaxID=1295565 RepID=UPI0020744AF9|nr:NUDIX hydrolase [Larsenimonas salina]MCM5704773.1 NUDIX hydrolase [Larsenimonas salina]